MWSEGLIARAIALQVLDKKCVVLVPNCNWTGNECDVLAVTMDLRIIDVEIKITRADLKADAAKAKWWHRMSWADKQAGAPATHREWPAKVWKHYYAVPKDIWRDDLLTCLPSPRSGVILLEHHKSSYMPVLTHVVRRAQPNRNAVPISAAAALDIARLANLRMWAAVNKHHALTTKNPKSL